MFFMDRRDAGRRLAARVRHLRGLPVLVLGLPRGGVPVAAEVAEVLDAPLDVCLVRKLGVPYQPELAMGAIGEGGVRVINDEVVRAAGVSPDEFARVEARERAVLEERAQRYRGNGQSAEAAGRTVLVVDDGVATGSTARAACRIVRARGAARVVLAVPVAPEGWTERLSGEADELICPETPRDFFAIGQFYADFSQVDDREVIACLERSAAGHARTGAADGGPPVHEREVVVEAGAVRLDGRLTVPDGAAGIVLFAHGSGSSRNSPRNQFVAAGLNRAGLGTLLFDLLTEAEEGDRANVFDTALLSRRLADATEWLRTRPEAEGPALGYFGASTGAAAALGAAAEQGGRVSAVVSRGGRPDLAWASLPSVTAPTLLIVGGCDRTVLELNQQAQERLRCESRIAVVPGATHLFAEPGALEEVTALARDWFVDHMAPTAHAAPV
ncbi:phosphoribosyltransferase family protein [Streptomyces sp. NPDC056061]|uniref:phosphoribosyltransferase family protein n=1 Tax=Streptomyces sp. NPDC056061 TaxID=3345700 RepID=UPI0035D9B316